MYNVYAMVNLIQASLDTGNTVFGVNTPLKSKKQTAKKEWVVSGSAKLAPIFDAFLHILPKLSPVVCPHLT